jgi:hypothetical protein
MADVQPQANPAHSSPLPPAIRRQAERAEALQRESTGQGGPPPSLQDAPPAAGNGPPAAEAPPASTSAPLTPEPAPGAPSLEEQLRTTQGRLNLERERNTDLQGQIANLNRMVGELQQRTQQAPPAPATTPLPAPPRGKLVTAEEEADYGKELLEVVGKRARDAVSDEIDDLKSEIKNLRGQLGQVGSRVAARDTDDLFTQLHREVPGWLEQNTNEEYIRWLQQPEPFSGIKRHDLLTRAFELNDAPRVIRFFKGFLDEAAVTSGAATPTFSSPAQPANGRVPLETFAAPGRATPAPASAPPGSKPTYTRAQISQFFTDKAAGKWRGRETEAAQHEADIFRAGPEGRVIG